VRHHRFPGVFGQVVPELPGEWCQVAAALHLQAGNSARAGRLFAEAGQRAMAQGAARSAVMLLDKALELLTGDADAQVRADTFAALLYALAEAGMVERALTSAPELEKIAGLLSRRARAQLHTRLAWAAEVANQPAECQAQIDTARQLLGPDASDEDTAPIDVVTAHLILDLPGADHVRRAEALARRAAAVAERLPLPITACQAWQLLAALIRSRDPDAATACLERARSLAVRHSLPIEEIHALIRLGVDDALRSGSTDRLAQVRLKASQVGAVTVRYQADANLALQAILQGEFATAETLINQVLAATTRLKLLEIVHHAFLLRAILSAHLGRRRDMEAALAELRSWGRIQAADTRPGVRLVLVAGRRPSPRTSGAGPGAGCRRRNPDVPPVDRAVRPAPAAVRAGRDRELARLPCDRCRPCEPAPVDRQFASFAHAVLLGQEGQAAAAAEAIAEALRVGMPYPGARHLGLRLVSEAAILDGWGAPDAWLRAAEEYFHACQVPAVASACRALMRQTGVPFVRHRYGAENVPPALRAAGITVREYEILQLLVDRLSNREIASRLHLSPRTVERHVGSLIRKTGLADRFALGKFGSQQGPE
jgi:DNA-binding CsgD family transcriptional regulator